MPGIRFAVNSLLHRRIAPYLPQKVKNNTAVRYLRSRILFKRLPHEKDTIALYTMGKSGSHYFRFFLTNYLDVCFNGAEKPMTYDELERRYPNFISDLQQGYGKPAAPDPVVAKAGYYDFVWGTNIEFSPARTVALYRNPLDYLVSFYYYRYVNNPKAAWKPESINEIVDSELAYIIPAYQLMDRLARRNRGLCVAYEEMMREPRSTFSLILKYLAVPLHMKHVDKAIEFSNFKSIRAQEDTYGVIGGADRLQGQYFTRSGAIGQWKTEIPPETVDYIVRKLADADIDINRFILE